MWFYFYISYSFGFIMDSVELIKGVYMRRRGGILRTAAIVGTATAVSGSVSHAQQQKYAAKDQQAAAAQAAAAAPAPAEQSSDDIYVQLEKLGQLKDQGILTEEEFTAKKSQILGL